MTSTSARCPISRARVARFAAGRTVAEKEAINQNIGVWRLGASYDLTGNGRTAVKASYSRYGLQVGIDRVTNVNPLTVGIGRLPVDRSERQPQVRRR